MNEEYEYSRSVNNNYFVRRSKPASAILLFAFKFRASPIVSIATSVLHFMTSICTLYSI